MTINVYQKGDLVTVAVEFLDSDDAPVDPDTVTFLYTPPSGTTVEFAFSDSPSEVVKDSVGNYHVDLVPDESGQYFYRWESTGSGQAAENGEFMVEPSNFTV
jgi:hypothetical protein